MRAPLGRRAGGSWEWAAMRYAWSAPTRPDPLRSPHEGAVSVRDPHGANLDVMELQQSSGFIRPKPFGTRLFNRNRDNDAYSALKLGGAGAMRGKRTKLFGWAPVLSM